MPDNYDEDYDEEEWTEVEPGTYKLEVSDRVRVVTDGGRRRSPHGRVRGRCSWSRRPAAPLPMLRWMPRRMPEIRVGLSPGSIGASKVQWTPT